jgi:Protein of unknown function (DUF1571)/LysM domain
LVKKNTYQKIKFHFLITKCTIVFFILMLFGAFGTTHENVSSREIVFEMLDSIRHAKTQRFELKSAERIGKGISFAQSKVKLNVTPRKIYFKSIHRGAELIWVEGKNKGNAIVHSKTVPFINLDLDPNGSLLRKDQHHTILDVGFQHIGHTIASTIAKHPKDFEKNFLFAGSIQINGYDCYQIIISYPEYKYIDYTTGKNETVTNIAHKLNTSDYKIRTINGINSYFGAIKEGKKLRVPVPYANKAIICIDKKMMIPVSLKMYDEEGLYEAYEYTHIELNKAFAADEFSITFKDYNFND